MRRFTGILLVAVAVLAGCGTAAGSRGASRSPRAVPSPTVSCPEAGGRRISFGADHATGPLYGSGSSGVVLVNQSDLDWCGWFPLPKAIDGKGRMYLGFDTAKAGTVADIGNAVAELRRRGATHVVVVGASAGARDSLVAATKITPRVDAVIALSPERRDYVMAAVPKLRVPTLIASARQDSWVPAADAKAIAAAVPARYRHQVLTDGSRHGIDMATYDAPKPVLRTISSFLDRYAPGG
jgi:pimeloyl-ACP methyl ester carboxylesterase